MLCEAFPALTALVRLLSAVHHGVPEQIAVFGEAASALSAGEGSLARVTAQMLFEPTELTEALLAERAAKELLTKRWNPVHFILGVSGTYHLIVCMDLFRLIKLHLCLYRMQIIPGRSWAEHNRVLWRWKCPVCVFRERRPHSRLLIVLLRFNLESQSARMLFVVFLSLHGRLGRSEMWVLDL